MPKIFILILVIVTNIQVAHALESISELKWENRIILVRVTNQSEEILYSLHNSENNITERDIYWFVFAGKNIKTNYQKVIQDNFYTTVINKYFTDSESNVVLIGKDGGIKHENEYLDLNELFELIDTMPMRQQEMRK